MVTKINDEKELIPTNIALQVIRDTGLSISLTTLISWAQNYKIGKKIGGRWHINKQKLLKMLEKGNA